MTHSTKLPTYVDSGQLHNNTHKNFFNYINKLTGFNPIKEASSNKRVVSVGVKDTKTASIVTFSELQLRNCQ